MNAPIRSLRFIHKAIRRQADIIEDLLHEEDELDRELTQELSERLVHLTHVVDLHTRGEEAGLFPMLEARVPNVAATYLFDHVEERRHLDALAYHMAELARTRGEGREESLARARRAAVALAEHLHLHIRKEHKHILPLVEERFSTEEQGEMVRKLLEVVPADERDAISTWVADSLDDEERAEMNEIVKMYLPIS